MAASVATGRAATFDRERAATFLDKADIGLPDARLVGLRAASDAELGIDQALLRDAMSAFGPKDGVDE